jgi:RNA polymerase sigma-70 factor, ECF subfamily
MPPVPQASRSRASAPAGDAGRVVRAFPVTRDDVAIVRGLRAGEPWARAALFDRCAPAVGRIVQRVLGTSDGDEIAELVHEVFLHAMAGLDKLRDPEALVGWMQTIATNLAYRALRARRARRWLLFWEPAELPEPSVEGVDPGVVEAFRRTYAALDKLPADERVAFVLRYIEGFELERVAALCDVSLATIKRRLVRAEKRFASIARADEVLRDWLERGGRWTT